MINIKSVLILLGHSKNTRDKESGDLLAHLGKEKINWMVKSMRTPKQ